MEQRDMLIRIDERQQAIHAKLVEVDKKLDKLNGQCKETTERSIKNKASIRWIEIVGSCIFAMLGIIIGVLLNF